MHPAFSVILFTTLSGAGYGLLAWTGLVILLSCVGGEPPREGIMPLLWAVLLAMGLLLTLVGLLSSTFHLGKPLRAWRAFSQWRTSWLSREGVAAVAATLATGGLLAVVGIGMFEPGYSAFQGPGVPLLAALVVLLAGATVACTAMIYASLKPIPAWRHRLVLPGYGLFAVLGGWLLLLATGSWTGLTAGALGVGAGITLLIGSATALLKAAYWRDIDRIPAAAAATGSAVGLPGRDVRVFEHPHTEPNYLTREMGFVLARRHARRLRAIAVLLFAVVPALATTLAWAVPDVAGPCCTLAALSALLGSFVERWLFFAQARHAVMAYY
ncbi:dimethyl sulfoxide reductase anchor subunit [Lysobacter sp. SG-8]|uniref:Dimethyl sulfoxide reductase anchor subunit n=1 Tax=Marilutibacter penaei TaxID=2759900 RepID=A0A7W3YDA9_9GAMM|nr:DmsC/YnfH family molybdoenzyme membrane anchor subunit [Lysobacter penaei]MBB1087168.1 dimethyl sulfoxide reductase anchor subunit [Lysobacter penaei]